jgi:cytochrome b561
MRLSNTASHYGLITRLLHTLIALLIIAQIIIALMMEYMSGKIVGTLYFVHKSLGLTLLFLAIIFIVWRFFNPRPKLPTATPLWQRIAANTVQFCLYLLILIMPLSGWLMSNAAGYPPSFWGWFTLGAPIAQSKALASLFDSIHVICAWLISILIIIHVLGALKHYWIDKDKVLQSMFCGKN